MSTKKQLGKIESLGVKFWGHRINTILASTKKATQTCLSQNLWITLIVVDSPKQTRWIGELNYYHSYTPSTFTCTFFFDQQRNRRDQLELVLCLLRVSLEVHCVVFPVVSRLCEVQRVLLSALTWATLCSDNIMSLLVLFYQLNSKHVMIFFIPCLASCLWIWIIT